MENLTINAENQQILDNVTEKYGVDCKDKLNINFSEFVELVLEEIGGYQEEEEEELDDCISDSDSDSEMPELI